LVIEPRYNQQEDSVAIRRLVLDESSAEK